MNRVLYEYLAAVSGKENVLLNEPMSRHTTFRVGGEAEYFVNIDTKENLVKLVTYLQQVEMPMLILGKGSNLLVSDKGFKGVVLNLSANMNQITVSENIIKAQAGASLSDVAKAALDHSLTGLAFAAGIPGTIGGAVTMNAGAYDREMSQVVKSVTVINKDGEILQLDNATMEFSYRNSVVKKVPLIVVEVELELTAGAQEAIKAQMDDLNNRRKEKQPLDYPSAGSTFKRPEGNFAGKLIMDAGLRGYRIGGAQVSEKHCGFVINVGNATATDVAELIDDIIEKVEEQFDIILEPEVVRIGDF